MTKDNDSQMVPVDEGYSIIPRNLQAQINEAVQLRDALSQLFERVLENGKDYAIIPGTNKPALLKPGAEMLCKVFKLAPGKAEVLDKNEDWEMDVFAYTIGMPIIHLDSGIQVSYGMGAANSKEKKHRYRNTKDENGKPVQVDNPDPADLQNTLIKMASKRAFVDAVLKATGASRMFANGDDFGASGSKNTVRGHATQQKPQSQTASPAVKPLCADCGVIINLAENDFSIKKYGRPLCRKCQGDADNQGKEVKK